jgi:hypothetical protein
VFNAGHSFLAPAKNCVHCFFIILVDRIFTSFVEGAFTSIFDVSIEILAIACVYRARNAN